MSKAMTEMPKSYDHQATEAGWYARWETAGLFTANAKSPKPKYTICLPPPNVTGELHMGHALNNTLQDVLIRWRRTQGFNAEWMPGTDHAGIATQAVVERLIFAQEKKTRHDLGREELVKRIWQWKDKYEKRILDQLRALGCSCDWPRTRFTFDEGCSRAVRQTFFNWFRDGYIFRGKRGDKIKVIWYTGDGLALFYKRLSDGTFVWPQAKDGTISLSAAQLSMLLEGIDWRRPKRTAPAPQDPDRVHPALI